MNTIVTEVADLYTAFIAHCHMNYSPENSKRVLNQAFITRSRRMCSLCYINAFVCYGSPMAPAVQSTNFYSMFKKV